MKDSAREDLPMMAITPAPPINAFELSEAIRPRVPMLSSLPDRCAFCTGPEFLCNLFLPSCEYFCMHEGSKFSAKSILC